MEGETGNPHGTHLFLNWFLAIILSVLFSHCAFKSRTLHAWWKGDGSGVILERALDCQHSIGGGGSRWHDE